MTQHTANPNTRVARAAARAERVTWLAGWATDAELEQLIRLGSITRRMADDVQAAR
jgi:hypothetical protein